MERRLFWGAAGRDGGTQEPLDDSEREESKRREGGKVQKGEREGKGKKERGRERAERREGGKGQKGERQGGRERLHLDSPSGTGHRRRIFLALCFDLQIHISTSPWGREGGKFFLNVQQSLHPERALQGSPHPPPQPNTENSLTPNLHGIISDYT